MAARTASQRTTFTFELPARIVEKIESSGAQVPEFVEAILRSLDQGAVLIPAEVASELRRRVPQLDWTSLPDLVSRALEITETEMDFRVRIDSFYHRSLKELAERQGTDVRTMIQSALHHALDMGWLYDCLPAPITIRLTAEQLAEIARALGVDERDVDGNLIVEAVCRSTKQTA